MGDSAFRRLLLDTVAVVIAKPPSASALIELLRVATPGLAEGSESSAGGESEGNAVDRIVRDVARRERLFKTLKLRIHPDKHPNDDRVTGLFQDVQCFYDRCVDRINEETTKGDSTGSSGTSSSRHGSNVRGASPAAAAPPAAGPIPNPGRGHTRTPPSPNADAGRPSTDTYPTTGADEPWRTFPGAKRNPAGASTHSDYVSYDDSGDPPGQRRQRQRRRRRTAEDDEFAGYSERDRPSSHQCCAVVSVAAFPPLGLCAAFHSYKVQKAWDEKRYGDAMDHSAQAYNYAWFAYLTFVCLVLYFWLRDGDWDLDFDHMFDR